MMLKSSRKTGIRKEESNFARDRKRKCPRYLRSLLRMSKELTNICIARLVIPYLIYKAAKAKTVPRKQI